MSHHQKRVHIDPVNRYSDKHPPNCSHLLFSSIYRVHSYRFIPSRASFPKESEGGGCSICCCNGWDVARGAREIPFRRDDGGKKGSSKVMNSWSFPIFTVFLNYFSKYISASNEGMFWMFFLDSWEQSTHVSLAACLYSQLSSRPKTHHTKCAPFMPSFSTINWYDRTVGVRRGKAQILHGMRDAIRMYTRYYMIYYNTHDLMNGMHIKFIVQMDYFIWLYCNLAHVRQLQIREWQVSLVFVAAASASASAAVKWENRRPFKWCSSLNFYLLD